MDLHILTTAEEKILLSKHHKYTSKDVNDLSILSSAIEDLSNIMIDYYLSQNDWGEDGRVLSVFSVLDLLSKPISRFLNEGAPVREAEGKEEATEEGE
ncbi:MAG: hypothetical protein LBH43_13700 [Treponema sp.]|jgi:hypothetical protein|nr:hypothetical protein [Treponema sp.]